jgi:hypothetical protein
MRRGRDGAGARAAAMFQEGNVRGPVHDFLKPTCSNHK